MEALYQHPLFNSPLYPLKIQTNLYTAAKRGTFSHQKVSHVPPHLQAVSVNETQLAFIRYFYAFLWKMFGILYAVWNVISQKWFQKSIYLKKVTRCPTYSSQWKLHTQQCDLQFKSLWQIFSIIKQHERYIYPVSFQKNVMSKQLCSQYCSSVLYWLQTEQVTDYYSKNSQQQEQVQSWIKLTC